MSESTIIDAFLKLQNTNNPNIFEAAKKIKTRYEGGKEDKSEGATSMTNEPEKVEKKSSSDEEETDRKMKVALGGSKGPEDYFKKDSPNAAEKPSEEEIDRRMRVALGSAKGPEDYFKIHNKPKSTDDGDNKTSAVASTSVDSSSGMPVSIKNSKSVSVAKSRQMSEASLVASLYAQMINEKKMKGVCQKCGKGPCQCGGDPKKMEEEALDEKLVGNQKKLDKNHNNKLDSQDFKMLRGSKKVEEAAKPDYIDIDKDGDKKESMKKAAKEAKAKKIKDYRADRDKHGEMEEEVEQIDERDMENKAKKDAAVQKIGSQNKDDQHLSSRGMRTDVADKIRGREVTQGQDRKQYREDVKFSEAELAHFASVLEGAGPVDQGKADQRRLRSQQTSRGIGDTVPNRDLTDEFEYIDEMARGVKAGTKRGSYKNTKSTRGGADSKAGAVETEEPKGVPHVLDQIRHGHEDEHGFKTITHPASSPEAPVSKRIHRSELHGFYDKYHNTEKPRDKETAYGNFLTKHFGDASTHKATSRAVTTDLSKIEKSTLKGGAGKVSLGGSSRVGGKK